MLNNSGLYRKKSKLRSGSKKIRNHEERLNGLKRILKQEQNNDWSDGEARNKERLYYMLEKELLDIISMFSEDRKDKNKLIDNLKHENKKLKHFKANWERESSARNRYR